MSSSNIMPEADRPSAVDTDSTQSPGTFLRHVLKSHSDRFTRGHYRCNGLAGPSTKCGSVQSYDGTE